MTYTDIALLSTVVAPSFEDGELHITTVSREELVGLLGKVTRNYNGHPVTDAVLRELCPTLPPAERAFWDGSGLGLAVRPKGGVRGASQQGDTKVTLDDLEAVTVYWKPHRWVVQEGTYGYCQRCLYPIAPGRVVVCKRDASSDCGGDIVMHEDGEVCDRYARSRGLWIQARDTLARREGVKEAAATRHSGIFYPTAQTQALWDDIRWRVESDAQNVVYQHIEFGTPMPE